MHSTHRKRIAVVGSGIAGLGAAWLLQRRHAVTLFERNDYLGGHTHTLDVASESKSIAVDTGFMVFNRPNYPLLSALFDYLGVQTYATSMTFSASIDAGAIEYAGTNLDTLFAQRANLVKPRYWKMLGDIVRFNRAANAAVTNGLRGEPSLGEWLDWHRFGPDFRAHYLLPMAAAIWSCPTAQIVAFPAASFLRFFANHGLIKLRDRPQWQTVVGGSRSYVAKLRAQCRARFILDNPAHAVMRDRRGVTVTTRDGETHVFDAVVLACHADEALRLLSDASADERAVLGAFHFQPNRTWLHRDPHLMPKRRKVWASWNYLSNPGTEGDSAVSVTYWMNALQALDSTQNHFVSLNPQTPPRDEFVDAVMTYEHPVFDRAALRAQRELKRVQGVANTWFAGAWTGYGFHEDGLRSAVEVGRALGVAPPWNQASIAASRALIDVADAGALA
ncbi:MAG: NAD(P)/FAD-dependent oxidoreductase [Thiotrichales bacterium]